MKALVPPVLLAASLLCDASRAHAESGDGMVKAALVWNDETTESCLDPAALRDGVEAHLGRTVFVAAEDADVELRVRIERDLKASIVVHVAMTSGAEPVGTRIIESAAPQCSAFRDTLALVVGMLVDVPRDDLELRKSTKDSGPQRERALSAALPPRSDQGVTGKRNLSEPGWHFAAALAGDVGYGLVPGPAFGPSFTSVLGPNAGPSVRVAVEGLPQATVTREAGQVLFRAVLVSAGIAPVAVTIVPTLLVRPWGTAVFGVISAEARGFSSSYSGQRTLYGFAIGTDVAWAVADPFFFSGEVRLMIPFVRPGFTAEEPSGTVDLHRVRAVSMSGGIGIGWRFR